MGITNSNSKTNINPQKIQLKNENEPYIFDTTIVPEKYPEVQNKITNTAADRIVPQHKNKNQIKTAYDLALEDMQKKNEIVFKDQEFDAIRSSISTDPSFKVNKNIVWKRPSEFLQPGQIKLFDTIEPMDIKQGELEDCYFLSSLSALAEIPQCIEKLFRHKTYQENGLYGVYLCQNGILQEIVVDDRIPCLMQGGPVFSRANGNELWVLLLEKAYAKIYGSYHKIVSGLSSCALKDLTGAPSEYFIRKSETLQDADLCWNFIEKYDKMKYILTASSASNQGGRGGIVSQHCYAILDVQRVVGSDGQQDRIIKIRNPWGEEEQYEDWSDNSEKWTQELRQKLQVQKKDDGIFWMSVKDFIKRFSHVCVCKFDPLYLYTATILQTVNNKDSITKKIMLMRVYEKNHAFISLSQKDKRLFGADHQYSLARLIIGQLDDQTNEVLHYSGAAFDNEREIVVEKEFQPGCYALYIEVEWSQDYDRYLSVSSYGSKSVQFSELNVPQNEQNQVIASVFDGFLRAHERDTEEEIVKDIEPGIRRISGFVGGYQYYWFQNETTKKTLHQIIQFNNLQHIEVCPPYTDPQKVMVVYPMSTVMLKLRVTQSGEGAYGFHLKYASQIIEAKSDQEIIQQALTKPSEKNVRSLQGKQIQVTQYSLKFPAGIAFYYENNENRTYIETIRFEVTNLQGVDIDISKEVIMEIQPGQSKLIQLKSLDPTKNYQYKLEILFHQCETIEYYLININYQNIQIIVFINQIACFKQFYSPQSYGYIAFKCCSI